MLKQDIQTEYFAVRVFHDFDDMWCEIERFAGLERRRRDRLPDLAREFGLPIAPAHSIVRMEGEDLIPSRVAEYARFIKENYDVLRNIPFSKQNS